VVVRVLSSSHSSGSLVLLISPDTQLNFAYEQGLQNLLDRIERMRGLGPEFVDITWSVALPPYAPLRLGLYTHQCMINSTGMREDERAK
jgi:hypothetical protein